jgi:hypothetical protein
LIRGEIERDRNGEQVEIGARRDELHVVKQAERFDPEGARVPKGERGQAGATRAPEIGVGNGSWAMKAPRVGLETERSERVQDRTDPRRFLVWNRRCRTGTLTPEWRESVVTGE